MSTFWWIFFGGVAMSAIALVGSITLLLEEETLQKLLPPLVAFAAGSLLGGAFFHMLPGAMEVTGFRTSTTRPPSSGDWGSSMRCGWRSDERSPASLDLAG